MLAFSGPGTARLSQDRWRGCPAAFRGRMGRTLYGIYLKGLLMREGPEGGTLR